MLEISGKHQDKSDKELLEKFQHSRNLDELGELYSRYMHLVYGVSLKYLGNQDDAKDAVMQIFEKLITDLAKHEIQTFKSWLYVLTKNHCLMEIRSRKSAENRMEGLKFELDFMESEEDLHPIDRDDSTVEDALKACIEQLKIEQKQCIEMFYYQKLCYQEIAEKLQMEVKKVKSYLQNGKRNLKTCLEDNNVR